MTLNLRMQQEPLHGSRIRAVTIEHRGDTYFVKYVTRQKGQRYCAGQFYAPDTTIEQIRQWVKDQQHLVLLP